MSEQERAEGKSFRDQQMSLSPELKALLPDENLSYLERTNEMHFGPGEGGSKFNDANVRSIFDVIKKYPELGEAVSQRRDDREALIAAGAPENAFLPAVKGSDAPPGLPEALYYKVENVEGRLGIIKLKDLSDDTKILVRREKGKSDPKDKKTYVPVSFTVVRGNAEDMPRTDFATVIVGRSDGAEGKDAVWTVHPGAPIRPAGGEFPFTAGLLGPDEIGEGEKQPAHLMTVAELRKQTGLGDEDYIKIIPGDLETITSNYQVRET